MNDLLFAFLASGAAPGLGLMILCYCMGRRDGQIMERNRRRHFAYSLLARKRTEVIRL